MLITYELDTSQDGCWETGYVGMIYALLVLTLSSAVVGREWCRARCPCTGPHSRLPSPQKNGYYLCTDGDAQYYSCKKGYYFDADALFCRKNPKTTVECSQETASCPSKRSLVEGSGSWEIPSDPDCGKEEGSGCEPSAPIFQI